MSNEESIESREMTGPTERDVSMVASRAMRLEIAALRARKALPAYRALEKLSELAQDLNDTEIFRPDEINRFNLNIRPLEARLRQIIRDNEDKEAEA